MEERRDSRGGMGTARQEEARELERLRGRRPSVPYGRYFDGGHNRPILRIYCRNYVSERDGKRSL